MLINLEYDPEVLVCSSEQLDSMPDEAARNFWSSVRVKDIFEKLGEGIYEFWESSSPNYIDELIKFYEISNFWDIVNPCYGICDNFQQILERDSTAKELISRKDKTFILVLCEVRRVDQPEDGGWRWHKWGDYIGDYKQTSEYLYDEVEIDKVYTYHFLEVKKRWFENPLKSY